MFRHFLFLLSCSLLSAEDLSKTMAQAVSDGGIPGVGQIQFAPDTISKPTFAGTLSVDSKEPPQTGSKWHIGSDAKAMTATLLARLVEKRKLTWESTMAEIFPKESKKFHPEARKITITQLLSHTAGLPANPPVEARIAAQRKGNRQIEKQRREILFNALKDKPGDGFLYSNTGFIGAGVVAETLLKMSWEEAMEQEVFKPLGIKSVGYGAPKGKEVVRGHVVDNDGKRTVTPMGYLGDNPAIYGPAGGLHLSLGDWALFAQDQLNGHFGKGKLLSPESYQKLHTPVSENYALGWGIRKNKDGKVTRLAHDGSNTMWYARVIIDLKKKTGVCVVANDKGEDTPDWVGKIADVSQKD